MAIMKTQDLTPCGMAKELALVTGSGIVRAEICIDSLASAEMYVGSVVEAEVNADMQCCRGGRACAGANRAVLQSYTR